MDVSGADIIMMGIAVVIALVEAGVAISQFRLNRKLRAEAKHTQTELEAKVTKQEDDAKEMREELEAKATKEELKRAVGETVRETVPEVLQEMAQQYASQGAADQQGSSGVDSR